MSKQARLRNVPLLLSAAMAAAILAGVSACGSAQQVEKTAKAENVDADHDHSGHDHEDHAEDGHGDEKAHAHDDHAGDKQTGGDDHQHDEEEEGVVELTETQIRAAGIEVVSLSIGGGAETRLSGRVSPMVDARAVVGASVGGVVERVLVAPGEPVKAGQPLVIVVSGDAASVRADVDAARARAESARQALLRSRNLFDHGIVAQQEVEALTAEAASAEAAARAAEARAAASGRPDAAGRLSIVSPIDGVLTSMQVGPGGFLAQGSVVAEITDPSRVEIVFNAPPLLAASVQVGSRMRVSGASGELDATITGVAADAGAGQSGAAIIRVRPQEGIFLPSGTPVSGSIVTGTDSGTIIVPSDAVQSVDGKASVFVQTEEGFRAVSVLTGRQAGGRTEILRGLDGREKIAGRNAFLLKAELAKGEADHAH